VRLPVSARTLCAGVAAASLLYWAGCATARLPSPGVPQRARAATTYSASLRAQLSGRDLKGRARVIVAFRRPDALRIEMPGPTGLRLLAVINGDTLTAVFPAARAVFRGSASAADLDAVIGIALSPPEVMDLLVGVPSTRLRAYRAWWGQALPRRLDATLPDGGRLRIQVDGAEMEVPLPAAAFEEPSHRGYREVGVDEARDLAGAR
jgi:hypothetical protein